jgi:hypothetical protein
VSPGFGLCEASSIIPDPATANDDCGDCRDEMYDMQLIVAFCGWCGK